MAEIRVRDASPQLIKGLEAIAMELREATITGTLTKMIPRYLDMKKRIEEQNKEIADLSKEVRQAKYKEGTLHEHFEVFVSNLKRSLIAAQHDAKTFGTNKKARKPDPGAKKKKLSPTKKRK